MLKKMNFFIFLSLAISIVVGTPDSDLPLFDDNDNLIEGESEFPPIDSYPWTVSFGEYDNQALTWIHSCGGVIISKYGIATAAHCFYGKEDFNTFSQIRVGHQNENDDIFAETYDILTIVKHPEYIRLRSRNDLAIVFTDREIEFNVKVNSIDLPTIINTVIDGSTNQTANFSDWGLVREALSATNFTIFTGEYCEDNLDFIEKWLPLGEYFASQDTNDTDLFYLKKFDPHLRFQYLWTYYPNNEDVYSKIFFDVCEDPTYLNNSLDTYGINCSLYNSMVNKVCQNGQSELDNFEKFNVNCSITKMLVVTGYHYDSGQKTELIDLGRPNIMCDLPDFPIKVYGSVGFNNVNGPTICGGFTPGGIVTKECYNLNSDLSWERLTKMTTTRARASVTQIDSDEVLIMGGFDEVLMKWTDLKSTEIVSFSRSEASEDLPFTISAHCTLKINETTVLITGGTQDGKYGSDATWFMDIFTFKISPGPRLRTGREDHGCATLNLGGKNYGIITGGWRFKTLDTTEILDLQDLEASKPWKFWKNGPQLTSEKWWHIRYFPLVITNQGVFLVGGKHKNIGNFPQTNYGRCHEIIQLYCQDDIIENCQWKEYEQKLQNPRSSHVVIPLPESYDICTFNNLR